MTEIEKMYENAGIKGEWRDYRTKNGKVYEGKNPKNRNIRLCKPDFTTEKQLKLIKWLAKRDYGDYTSSLLINITDDRVYFSAAAKPTYYTVEVLYDSNRCTDFENALANLINNLWQDLTDQEKDEIRGILNEG